MTIRAGTTSRAGRHTTGNDGRYQVVADLELSSSEEAEIEMHMAQLEANPEPNVSTALRWGRAQLDVVRRAARLAGVPYQTYLKEAAFRCALADLRAAREAGVEIPEARRS
jgi:predicted DNA binding CopG/RHH family protein